MKLIALTSKKGQGLFAKVDDEDYDELNKYSWRINGDGVDCYAIRTTSINKIPVKFYMHREVLGLKKHDGKICDHKDGDKLNNQKSNLRLATISQNQANKKTRGISKYNGVTPVKNKCKYVWRAQISLNRKRYYLGTFNTEEEAALAYNKRAIELHGEFARLNITTPTNQPQRRNKMDIDKLREANSINNQIGYLQNILTRLECGRGFFLIKFIGEKNKTMDGIEEIISDKSVAEIYHKIVNKKINELKEQFKKL